MDTKMLRVWFCGCLATLLAFAALGFVACDAGEEWSVSVDNSLDCLTTQVAGGNVVAMPGDGWAVRDGYIQIQLSGGSLPERALSASSQGDTLFLYSVGSENATTLDLVVSEYRITGGDVSAVRNVVLQDSVTGESRALEQAYK